MTDPKTFPIQDGRPIPWALIAPHEAQAMKNHGGQSLRRLAERQGLSPCEAMCAIRGEGIGKLLRERHGFRRDKQTAETSCRCTCAHELEDLAERHRRASSAPSELERLRETLRIAEQERDAARATNQRLNRRCGDYERALAEKRSLCSNGKPRGPMLSRAMLNAYVTELLAAAEVLEAENDALRELAWRWCITAKRELDLTIMRHQLATGGPIPGFGDER